MGSSEQTQNVSSVRRESWPIASYDVMECLSKRAARDEKTGATWQRGSWWTAESYSMSNTQNKSRGSRSSCGKRRRSRAVTKPPITQLPAQDKAHFKRIVQLFTGLGASPYYHPLLKPPRSTAPALASLLLSDTSPSLSLSSPPPVLSPRLSLLPQYTDLDLDIISALFTPIPPRVNSSRSLIAPSSFETGGFFNKLGHLGVDSNSLLASDHMDDLSPPHDELGVLHSLDNPKDTFLKPSRTQIPNIPMDTPLKPTPIALRTQIHNTAKDTTPNLNGHVEFKSLFTSPLNGTIDFKPSNQSLDTPTDTNHLPCIGGVSCSTNHASLHGHVDLNSVGSVDTINDTNPNSCSISCNHDIALNGHDVDRKFILTSISNGTSPKDITMEQKDMVGGELSPIHMDNTENQVQRQVNEFEQQVKELENFLLKELDKVDHFFSVPEFLF